MIFFQRCMFHCAFSAGDILLKSGFAVGGRGGGLGGGNLRLGGWLACATVGRHEFGLLQILVQTACGRSQSLQVGVIGAHGLFRADLVVGVARRYLMKVNWSSAF